jgi:hypothetical protein
MAFFYNAFRVFSRFFVAVAAGALLKMLEAQQHGERGGEWLPFVTMSLFLALLSFLAEWAAKVKGPQE